MKPLRMLNACLGALLVGAFAIPSAGSAADLPTVEWKFAQPAFPKGSDRMDSAERVVEKVAKRTDGKFKLKLYGPELGDWVEVDEMVMRGTIDLALNSLSTTSDPRWNLVYTPYIVSSYEEAAKAYGPGGFIDQMFSDWAADSDYYWLGTYVQGFAGVSLSTRPATTPAEAKGLRIRVPPIAAFECYWKKLGFDPALIPYSEVPTAISTHVVDGQAGGGPFQTWSCCRDLNRYFVWYRDYLETLGYFANADSWAKLPAAYQKVLQDVVNEEVVARIKEAEAFQRGYMKKLKDDKGFEVVDLGDTPDKLTAARDAARECWPVMDEVVGKIWMDKIRTFVGSPSK